MTTETKIPKARAIASKQRTALDALLEAPAQASPAPRPTSMTLLGRVTDTHNPDLPGRVFVRWTERRKPHQAWLTYVVGSTPRRGDSVLLIRPGNDPQWLVTAVLSGAAPESTASSTDRAQTVRLQPGQRFRIEAHDGTGLVEIGGTSGEVSVRLLGNDVTLEATGRLRLAGRSVEIEGGVAGVEVRTDHEVVVRGRQIRLN